MLCMRIESPKPSGCKLGGWLHTVDDGHEMKLTTLPKRERPNLDWGVLAETMFTARNAAEERHYLAKTLGLKESALIELQVGRGWDDYRSLSYSSWPERDASGKVVGIVRRYRDGAKKTMRWSGHGLYFASPLLRMSKGPVFMPEGGSDTAALLGLGMNVVGRPSNLGGVDQLSELLVGIKNPIVVIGERDKKQLAECSCGTCGRCWPGLFGAIQTADRLAERLHRRVLVRFFRGAKDAREWVNANRDASGVDAIKASYRPERDCCRVCGNAAPHEDRRAGNRIEVLCRECRCLLESKRA